VKVVFATGIYPPDIGGPATYVSRLAPALAARGHAVEVITYANRPEPVGPPDGIPVRRVRRSQPLPLRYAAYFAAVRRRARGADVVFLQDPISSGLPGLAAARSLGLPAVLKVVGDLAWEISTGVGWVKQEIDVGVFQRTRYAPWVEGIRWAEHSVARSADRVLVPSAYLAEVVRGWGVRPDRVSVIENAAPPVQRARSREDARKALGLGAGRIITSAGRMLPHKGFDLLVAAGAELRHDLAPLTVVIAGAGPCHEALVAQIAAAGLTDTVRLTGALSSADMALLLQASDVFVLLSSYEGRSHVLLEAMGAGLPIVASDIPGNRELLRDRANITLVPRDASVVAAALRAVARRPRPSAAAADERRPSASTGWEEMVARTVELFERTCRRG
jgi:glycosyltransferase involved in cell wall biosynthesis